MLNLDFSQRVVINSNDLQWSQSPMPGVLRKRLAREEAERGHATSIVKYLPGSRFRSHPHPQGEEIFVLEGVFSDESGDYPAGSYIRNPEGFEHAPFSTEGCVLFVKLHQFQPGDQQHIRVNTNDAGFHPGPGGLSVLPLHDYQGESTTLVFWPAGERGQPHTHFAGEEILVISGELMDEHGRYPAGSWIRSPHMSQHCPYVEQDTLLLMKAGHLGESGTQFN